MQTSPIPTVQQMVWKHYSALEWYTTRCFCGRIRYPFHRSIRQKWKRIQFNPKNKHNRWSLALLRHGSLWKFTFKSCLHIFIVRCYKSQFWISVGEGKKSLEKCHKTVCFKFQHIRWKRRFVKERIAVLSCQ